ncbi:MAG: hypothetical protein J1E81_05575 [Eubacterium sp.]|nr:hypothetical protein [Eubacterium sp.]
MEQFIKYIDSELPPQKNNELLYKFKRHVLEEMNSRYSEVMKRGITNTKVITDLVISEYPNLEADFKKFKVEQTAHDRTKRRLILNFAGSIIYILCLLIAFLGISFLTQKWSETWLIVVDGILLWVIYLFHIAIRKILTLKKIFHIFARMFLAGGIMVLSVAIFLVVRILLDNPLGWLILIAGVASMFIGDAVFAVATKRKLAIINVLVYIPVVTIMLYIILSAGAIIAWNTGWLLIIFSLILDFVIILAALYNNNKHKMEVIDTWKES